jgi:hypothetical protein
MVRELNDSRLDRIFAVALVFKVCYNKIAVFVMRDQKTGIIQRL